MFGLNPWEIMIIGALAVILFGKNLPSVGRSIGKGIVEFKKGLNGIQDEIQGAGNNTITRSSNYRSADDYEEPTTAKFEPPTSEPRPA
jgi:sec-independent protein translocase protein TatA